MASDLPPPTRFIGPLVSATAVQPPAHTTLTGRYTSLVPLQPTHAAPLFPLVSGAQNAHLWDYMFSGPFTHTEEAQFTALITDYSTSKDPLFFAVLPSSADASSPLPLGFLSLMRIAAAHRTIEIGNVLFTGPL